MTAVFLQVQGILFSTWYWISTVNLIYLFTDKWLGLFWWSTDGTWCILLFEDTNVLCQIPKFLEGKDTLHLFKTWSEVISRTPTSWPNVDSCDLFSTIMHVVRSGYFFWIPLKHCVISMVKSWWLPVPDSRLYAYYCQHSANWSPIRKDAKLQLFFLVTVNKFFFSFEFVHLII